jgi:peptide/nickel transport system substrate-binding protein
LHEEVSHVPLHQQSLAWGKSEKLDLVQRADNQVLFRWMTLND